MMNAAAALLLILVVSAGAMTAERESALRKVLLNRTAPFQSRMHAAQLLDQSPPRPRYNFTRAATRERIGLQTPFGVKLSIADGRETSADFHVGFRAFGTESPRPVVRWGTNASDLLHRAVATARRYTAADMCGAEGSMDGYAYDADLGPLEFATKYYYQVGFEDEDGSDGEFSALFAFTTRPAPGSDAAAEVRFLLYGDIGGPWAGGGDRNVAAMLDLGDAGPTGDNAFTLMPGDITYADGDEPLWDEFEAMMEPITAHHPFFVNMGNHEGEVWDPRDEGDDSNGECFVPAIVRYHTPRNSLGEEESDFYYSFVWGPVKIVVMSTQHDFSRGTAQHNFIVRELNSIDRSAQPWLIFVGHKCMYSEQDDEFDTLFREQLESVIIDAAVDLSVYGHKHDWQRFCSIENMECVLRSTDGVYRNPPAPVHLVVGMGGRNFDFDKEEKRKERRQTDDLLEEFIEELGFVRVVANKTHLDLQFVLADEDGEIGDRLLIVKQ